MKILGPDGKKIKFDRSTHLGKDGKPIEWERGMGVVGWTKPDPDEHYAYGMGMEDGLVEAFKFAFEMQRRNEGKDIPYEGPEVTANKLSTGFNIEYSLSAENLKYEGTSNDAILRRLIGCAMRLGMEQAYRMILDEGYLTSQYARDIRRDLDNPDPEVRRRLEKKIDSLEHRAHDPGQVLPALWGFEEEEED
jgi:hypothetical protein